MGTPLIFECPGDSVYVYNGEKKEKGLFQQKEEHKVIHAYVQVHLTILTTPVMVSSPWYHWAPSSIWTGSFDLLFPIACGGGEMEYKNAKGERYHHCGAPRGRRQHADENLQAKQVPRGPHLISKNTHTYVPHIILVQLNCLGWIYSSLSSDDLLAWERDIDRLLTTFSLVRRFDWHARATAPHSLRLACAHTSFYCTPRSDWQASPPC